ncbi:MAG: hypothetical protein M3P11_11250 [Actinomycetota bacterium]|nr:hypothetical protein [Actinomycetota bacterium]
MATRKQVQAAKRNFKKAAPAAKRARTIAHLPVAVHQDLSRNAAAAVADTVNPGAALTTERVPNSTRKRNAGTSQADRGWAKKS